MLPEDVLTPHQRICQERAKTLHRQLLGYDLGDASPRHPQTNGMVERFNGRIADLIRQTRFASALELENTLSLYLAIYNHSIPQRALGHLSPVQALKQWRIKQPELFAKNVYKQAGLDTGTERAPYLRALGQ